MLPPFFKILIQVLPAVLQPALLCMQFEDSAGNITVGARQIHFIILFSEFFFWFQRDSQRQRIVSCKRHMQTLIKFLFSACQKGLYTACKIHGGFYTHESLSSVQRYHFKVDLICCDGILKVHKIENFFGSNFEFCTISLLVLLKY